MPSIGQPSAVSLELADVRSYICAIALRAEPLLAPHWYEIAPSGRAPKPWTEVVASSPEVLPILAYRAEKLDALCRGLLADSFDTGSSLVALNTVDDIHEPKTGWWGAPGRGWDPASTPAKLTARNVMDLDSIEAARAAGVAVPDRAAWCLELSDSLRQAPFLVANQQTLSPDGLMSNCLLVNCGGAFVAAAPVW
jgi:hypothetical protein